MARPPHSSKEPRRATTAPPVTPEAPPAPHIAKGTRDDVSREAQRALSARRPRAIDDDIESVAHDVKTPLSIIMLEANVLEERLGHILPLQVRHGLDRILTNAAYIDRLVSDLLDLGCHDAGRLEMRFEPIELEDLLHHALERAVSTVDRTRVLIDIRGHASIMGDPVRLERVVSNLLANALKHGGRRAPVTVRLEAQRRIARISVTDSGPGLTEPECRAVFERYRRGATRGDGHGLGLYISRRIVEAHRGRIGVASTPGKGCRFYFELPLDQGI
jgi:signal transduction histidine kinase